MNRSKPNPSVSWCLTASVDAVGRSGPTMARRRVLLLLKPLDVYPPRPNILPSSSFPSSLNPKIISYLNSRCKVHKDTIRFCQDVLQSKYIEWEPVVRDNLCRPIRHVDLVITIGGDGTLLRASHFLDDSIPVLGVNSDPTQVEEVNELSGAFDATRSTGYLCAATAKTFEQVLDDVLDGRKQPTELARISIRVNGNLFPTCALNDILVAHPCPATVSRFSFRIKDDRTSSSLVSSRSSGLRISTATGSTAAILSAGGVPMPIWSQDLQYMVREPISPRVAEVSLLQGFVKPEQLMLIDWYTHEGVIYVDGCHVTCPLQYGNKVEVSAKAPILKVYLPREFSRDCSVTYHQPRSEL